MARASRQGTKRRVTPFKAGLLAAVVILVFSFFGFSRYNPFSHPYKLHAVFQSANNLQPKSPVRIAGVQVGQVLEVTPLKGGSGAAKVTMQIDKKGLPIHEDAEMKIRPRIFLEGNFFVDLQPGTPEAKHVKDGGTIPVQQTATPVQFGQVLEALQSDTRKDLQTFLREYAQEGLGKGGAEAYNKGLKSAPGAFRYSSIANQATLGTAPHDLSNLLRGQQRLFSALSTNPEVLKSLIENLNTTAGAFAREDVALARTVPALRDVLRVGRPALVSLNNTLPSLRAFARDALPGTRSSYPTIRASLPFITQLRLLVRQQELRGLAHDLRFAIPDLARVNHSTIPLLAQQRALSACQNRVLLPFAKTPIRDPDFETQGYNGSNGQPFYKEAPRGLVGLAGESRIRDANTDLFHVQFGSGPANVLIRNEGQTFVQGVPVAPEGVRPIKPNRRPDFRPGTPCEKQETPDLHAAGGTPDKAVTSTGIPILPGLSVPPSKAKANTGKSAAQQKQEQKDLTRLLNLMKLYLAQVRSGHQKIPDPLLFTPKEYEKLLRKRGLMSTPDGHIKPAPKSSSSSSSNTQKGAPVG